MHLLTIDPRHTVTYRPVEYRIPLGLAPYRPSVCGAAELAATLVARLALLGHRVEGPRYVEEEPRCDQGPVWDSLGSRAMRVECCADGRAVTWRYDRFARTLEAAWVVEFEGQVQPAGLSPYLRAHERLAALAWIAHRAIQGW
ncbi:hypothetical protein K388_07473 [Streptomyces sp. KhCrAH-43]|uniref:hypothetical protein n=1 Tax=unclassified Streptomyces TaxID=2593676 RepID=UPI00036F5F7E|nr:MULTISPECIES: hypothetical protein [unclassified Streptomyces]MYS32895.1 hypothetical protein [Streptomyces sp. SID4920]MYX67275.1 hypothetical protein [Streptomyces sp. SID8373]RAJ42590.1 hypothetical protein K388_07473 [Streptomyces sp. KhCrAH-43]